MFRGNLPSLEFAVADSTPARRLRTAIRKPAGRLSGRFPALPKPPNPKGLPRRFPAPRRPPDREVYG